jgi:transcriptional regulator of arginine metabolism
MKERATRLRAIRELIQNQRIESQEKLLELLEAQDFTVTQATLSRDLKFLKVGKISDGATGYYYTLPTSKYNSDSEKGFIQDVERCFLSMDFSGNIGVIQTRQGHADSVGYALYRLGFPQILGTLAGDDTVFIVLKEGVKRDVFLAEFRQRFPDLEL